VQGLQDGCPLNNAQTAQHPMLHVALGSLGRHTRRGDASCVRPRRHDPENPVPWCQAEPVKQPRGTAVLMSYRRCLIRRR